MAFASGNDLFPSLLDNVIQPRDVTLNVMEDRISKRLSPHKQANPWGVQRCATSLSALYASGGFPARINHGSISSKLEWQVDIENDDFDFGLLVVCCEGIAESKHPFTFIARSGFRDLLRTRRALAGGCAHTCSPAITCCAVAGACKDSLRARLR